MPAERETGLSFCTIITESIIRCEYIENCYSSFRVSRRSLLFFFFYYIVYNIIYNFGNGVSVKHFVQFFDLKQNWQINER